MEHSETRRDDGSMEGRQMLDILVVLFGTLFLLTMIGIGMGCLLMNESEIEMEMLNQMDYNDERRE